MATASEIPGWIRALQERPDGDRVRDLGNAPACDLAAQGGALALAALSLDARWALVLGFSSEDRHTAVRAQFWDLADDRPGPVLDDRIAAFTTSAALVPGTDLVAVPAHPTGVRLVDRGADEAALLADDALFQCVDVSGDGALVAAGSGSGDLVLWDRAEARQLACIRAHDHEICDLAWQPDGDRIATSSKDGTVRLWSARALLSATPRAPGHHENPLRRAPAATATLGTTPHRVLFSPDGTLCAVATEGGGACVIAASDGAVLTRVGGHRHERLVLAFHPNTGQLVTAGRDGQVQVWDPRTGARLAGFCYPRPPAGADNTLGITGLAFSADGRTIALSHASGVIRLWDLPPA
ncbi:MAG TPA: hypothetical protein VIK91_05380 [Nannocystis sp.]